MENSQNVIKVSIFDREYEIKGNKDQEYIRSLAEYVDSVMRQISEKVKISSLSKIAILAALNIADEMFEERLKLKNSIKKLQEELDNAISAISPSKEA